MAIINLNSVATDNTTDEILVRASNGDIRKVSKASIIAAGGAQDLQSVLENGSEGYVDTDITLTHSSGINRASMGLSDGNAMLEAGETTPNQFILSPTTAVLKSNLKIEPSVNPEDAVQRIEVQELIAEAGSGYIPLSGTESGIPVSGDIELDDAVAIKPATGAGIYFGNPAKASLSVSDTGDSVVVRENDDSLTPRGLTGNIDFTPNITDLDYPQKKYVDDAIDAAVGTPATLESVINNDGTASFSGNFSITRIVSSDVKNFINFDSDVDQTNINGKSGVNISAPSGLIYLSGNVNVPNQTASTLIYLDASKNIVSLPLATYPSPLELSYVKGVTSSIQTQLGLKAPLASPSLTGTPTTPTATANTNNTQIASTAYADAKVANDMTTSTTVAPSKAAVIAYAQPILNGSANNIVFADGSNASGTTYVQGRLIGTNNGDGSQLSSTTAIRKAFWDLQMQLNTMTAYASKTANYTLTTTDFCVDLTANTATFTLPTSVGATGKRYTLKNSGAGTLTVNTTSSQTIDGVTSMIFNVQYSGMTVISDGANWKVVGSF